MNTIFIFQFFKLNKLLINEAEDTIEAGLEEESEVLFGQKRKYQLVYQQRKRPGLIELLPSTEAVWCHYNFFQ